MSDAKAQTTNLSTRTDFPGGHHAAAICADSSTGTAGLLGGRPGWYLLLVTLTIELEREDDGRWMAEVPDDL
jgi:hypothetical protein